MSFVSFVKRFSSISSKQRAFTITASGRIAPLTLEGGYLLKRGDINRSWKKRWFSLVGNDLFYFTSSKEHKPLGHISLRGGTKVEKVPQGFGTEGQFIIHSPGQRRFLLDAQTKEDKEDWITVIQDRISCQKKTDFQGFLEKKNKQRFFRLTDNHLIYYKAEPLKGEKVIGVICLSRDSIVEEIGSLSFRVFSCQSKRKPSWVLTTKSSEDCQRWVMSIMDSISLSIIDDKIRRESNASRSVSREGSEPPSESSSRKGTEPDVSKVSDLDMSIDNVAARNEVKGDGVTMTLDDISDPLGNNPSEGKDQSSSL